MPEEAAAAQAAEQEQQPLVGQEDQGTAVAESEEPPVDLDGYQKLVEKLRDENKGLKATREPQAERDGRAIAALKRQMKDQADQAARDREAQAQAIGKALGLIKEDEKLDPAKLTEELSGAQKQIQQTKVELAVYQAAAAVGARPDALLDSRSFLNKISTLEPTDAEGIQAAIAEAVTANPAFAAGTGVVATVDPLLPKPNRALGASGGEAPTLDDQIAIATKAGDLRLAMHLQNQKLFPANGR